jgi:hypothetical protein
MPARSGYTCNPSSQAGLPKLLRARRVSLAADTFAHKAADDLKAALSSHAGFAYQGTALLEACRPLLSRHYSGAVAVPVVHSDSQMSKRHSEDDAESNGDTRTGF